MAIKRNLNSFFSLFQAFLIKLKTYLYTVTQTKNIILDVYWLFAFETQSGACCRCCAIPFEIGNLGQQTPGALLYCMLRKSR